MTGLSLFLLCLRLLVLAWVYIAYTDGLSDALWQAGGGILVIWWMYRWARMIVKR